MLYDCKSSIFICIHQTNWQIFYTKPCNLLFSCIKMLIFSKIFCSMEILQEALICQRSRFHLPTKPLSSANEAAFICQRSRLHLPTKPLSSANEAYCVCQRSLLRFSTLYTESTLKSSFWFFSLQNAIWLSDGYIWRNYQKWLFQVDSIRKFRKFFPTRPEGAEALSPGLRGLGGS